MSLCGAAFFGLLLCCQFCCGQKAAMWSPNPLVSMLMTRFVQVRLRASRSLFSTLAIGSFALIADHTSLPTTQRRLTHLSCLYELVLGLCLRSLPSPPHYRMILLRIDIYWLIGYLVTRQHKPSGCFAESRSHSRSRFTALQQHLSRVSSSHGMFGKATVEE